MPDHLRRATIAAALVGIALLGVAACAAPPDRTTVILNAPTKVLQLGTPLGEFPDGLPIEWQPYLGFDEIQVPPQTEWTDQSLKEIASNSFWGTTARQVALFELVLIDGDETARWFALIQEPGGINKTIGNIAEPAEDGEAEPDPIYMSATNVWTTLVSAGASPDEPVWTRVPTVPTKGGMPLLVDESLLSAAEGGSVAAKRALYITERRTLASLSTLLQTAAAHPDLGPLLMSVIEKPSLIGIIRHGGVVLEILAPHGKVEPAAVNWPGVGPLRAAAIPGIVLASGVRALEVEWLAVYPEEPLAFVSGIVHVSASHPKHSERRVELRLIGARSIVADATNAAE